MLKIRIPRLRRLRDRDDSSFMVLLLLGFHDITAVHPRLLRTVYFTTPATSYGSSHKDANVCSTIRFRGSLTTRPLDGSKSNHSHKTTVTSHLCSSSLVQSASKPRKGTSTILTLNTQRDHKIPVGLRIDELSQ
ncbi:hypothetical protein BDP55DRAFT_178978 [Colletotrichum godetiae]|uniref:Uncharacterized protein n=1 Tax=Colletotrichum godetiae TaxID=1209918 RepID=A0AAJ0ES27_9PEZI|nr:uncharacterized protein BDP55DRAFT_178978 [Colletotrichum godetiae]KAK1674601.1 hypothetical protein BDP55DRAFT_178978 [Colletotrichum godetiae]